MRFECFLGMTPPTATAQHKGERVVFDARSRRPMVLHYTKKPQRRAHDAYVTLLKAEINRQDRMGGEGIGIYKMFTGAIKVEIAFQFPHPASMPKRDRNTWFARTARPDLDNMAKGLLDCLMEVGLIQDDAQIFCLQLNKFNVPQSKAGVRVVIEDAVDCVKSNNNQEGNNNNG